MNVLKIKWNNNCTSSKARYVVFLVRLLALCLCPIHCIGTEQEFFIQGVPEFMLKLFFSEPVWNFEKKKTNKQTNKKTRNFLIFDADILAISRCAKIFAKSANWVPTLDFQMRTPIFYYIFVFYVKFKVQLTTPSNFWGSRFLRNPETANHKNASKVQVWPIK
jgi:hypothetical protein